MRRKVYADDYERKHDQRIGVILFIVVNVVVYLLYRWLNSSMPRASVEAVSFLRSRSAVQLLPWAVNGAFLLWAFLFRPQIGVGYIMSFGAILVICVGLFAIFAASCVVLISLSTAMGGGSSGGGFLIVIWIILLLVASIAFLVFGFNIVTKWWSGDK